MQIVGLKCKNCGADLEIEPGEENVKCKYCNATFTIEDAFSNGYNFEKGRMKAHDERREKIHNDINKTIESNVKTISLITLISKIVPLIMVLILVTVILVTAIKFIKKDVKVKDNNSNNFVNDVIDDIKDSTNEYEVSAFNSKFRSGEEYGSSLKYDIDKVITSNKTNKNHKITYIHNNLNTSDPNEIKEDKKTISDWNKYEVSLEYDDNGFVYQFIIEDY